MSNQRLTGWGPDIAISECRLVAGSSQSGLGYERLLSRSLTLTPILLADVRHGAVTGWSVPKLVILVYDDAGTQLLPSISTYPLRGST
jgi:hypothetical protein